MVTKSGVTLGRLLRATRLGYRQVPGRPFFMRLRRGEPGVWLFDLCPISELVPNPTRSAERQGHLCWWEADGDASVVDVPPISLIRTVKRPFTLACDDEGKPR